VLAVACALGGAGCHVKSTTRLRPSEIRPLLDSSREALLAKYGDLSKSVRTMNAKVELAPHTGSRYSGVIEDYKQVNGFILAVSPDHIRVIGQAPVVSTKVFDMVSDGETFRISIPPKQKFIVGPARFEHASKKPLENLRPQHILEAIFWPPLDELDGGAEILFNEDDETSGRYYQLTVVSRGESHAVTRRIWFDRSDLSLSRVDVFEAGGELTSVTGYSGWQAGSEGVSYPREISMDRPHDGYRLEIHIVSLTLNAEIGLDRFKLEQPAGTELVRVGEKDQDGAGAEKPAPKPGTPKQ